MTQEYRLESDRIREARIASLVADHRWPKMLAEATEYRGYYELGLRQGEKVAFYSVESDGDWARLETSKGSLDVRVDEVAWVGGLPSKATVK